MTKMDGKLWNLLTILPSQTTYEQLRPRTCTLMLISNKFDLRFHAFGTVHFRPFGPSTLTRTVQIQKSPRDFSTFMEVERLNFAEIWSINPFSVTDFIDNYSIVPFISCLYICFVYYKHQNITGSQENHSKLHNHFWNRIFFV